MASRIEIIHVQEVTMMHRHPNMLKDPYIGTKGTMSTTAVADGQYKSGSKDGETCRKRYLKGKVGPLRTSVEGRR